MSATDNWNHGWPQAADDYKATRTTTGVVLLRPNVKAETSELTEDALALRFSERHADDLRYIATKGTWLKWDGARWYPEATHMAFDLARQSCRADAQAYGNGKPPSSVYAAKTIAAVERMAKADRRQASTIEQFDANDSIFNAETATFDLQTGDSHEPRPDDYITKVSGCKCAPPDTPHPVWTAFLERVAPDPELRGFLQRFIGYSLTGHTSEHKFVFAYGTGANGKSTFINTITAILGDYATVADVGTFIAAATERHPTDVAKLHGYRLVVAQETGQALGRNQDQEHDGRRQNDGPVHALRLLRLCAEVQAVDCRQSQAATR